MEFGMKCADGISFQQKGLILTFLDPSLYELGNSFHSFNINIVEVDFVIIRLK
jgi:hypothetical protein